MNESHSPAAGIAQPSAYPMPPSEADQHNSATPETQTVQSPEPEKKKRKRKQKVKIKTLNLHEDSARNREFIEAAFKDFAGLFELTEKLAVPTQFSTDFNSYIVRIENAIALASETIDRMGYAIYTYQGGKKEGSIYIKNGGCGPGGSYACGGCPHPNFEMWVAGSSGALTTVRVIALKKMDVRSDPKLHALVHAASHLIQIREDQVKRLKGLKQTMKGCTNLHMQVISYMQQAQSLYLLLDKGNLQ